MEMTTRPILAAVAIIVSLCSAFTGPAHGQSLLLESTKLLATDGLAGDQFGYSTAVDGTFAVLGSTTASPLGNASGAAYMFRYNGSSWAQQQKLVPSDGAPGDGFGYSVAISGSYAVVGANGDDDLGSASGSVYVFRYNGSSWAQMQKLRASDGTTNQWFGYSVSISGNVIVVGAPEYNGYAGSSYVFRYNGSSWIQEQKIVASGGVYTLAFGRSVSVSGTNIVIGARDSYLVQNGAAFVFHYNGSSWIQQQILRASDAVSLDGFAESVAISNNTIVAGAQYRDDLGTDVGAAYVYALVGSTWTFQKKLLPSDGTWSGRFGISVAASNDNIVVGAFGQDYRGAAYAFHFDGTNWSQTSKLVASDVALADNLGFAVGLSGTTAVVGAPVHANYKGSAYIFVIGAAPPPNTAPLVSISNPANGASYAPGTSVTFSGSA